MTMLKQLKKASGIQRLVLGLCISIALSKNIFASEGAAAFLDKGPQPRAAAMGLGYSAEATGADSVYWNPAALSKISGSEGSLTTYSSFETQYYALQFATQWNGLKWGFSYIGSQLDGISVSQLENNPNVSDAEKRYESIGSTSYSGNGYYLGTGFNLTPQWAVGTTVKFVQETAYKYQASGIGADLGLLWTPNTALKLGLNARNIVPAQMKWNTPSSNVDSLRQSYHLGASYAVSEVLTLTSDYVLDNQSSEWQAGVEYWLSPLLAIRGGLNADEYALGTGLKSGNLSLDFSWTKPKDNSVTDIYRISISLKESPKK